MSKVKVEILSPFVTVSTVGALVITDTFGNVLQTVAPPCEVRSEYKVGEVVRFDRKRDALAWVAKHDGKARVLP